MVSAVKKAQPNLLVIWGKHDLSLDFGEPERCHKDVPKAQVLVLEAGHFALDTKADEITPLVRSFPKQNPDMDKQNSIRIGKQMIASQHSEVGLNLRQEAQQKFAKAVIEVDRFQFAIIYRGFLHEAG